MGSYTLRDRTALGALAGIAAILIRDAYNLLIKRAGLTRIIIWNLAAGLFLRDKAVHTVPGQILGFLVDTTLGAILGVIFAHLLLLIGEKNMVIKGMGFGLGSWLLVFGLFFHNLPATRNMAPKDPVHNLLAFGGHALFGIALGCFAERLLALLESRGRRLA